MLRWNTEGETEGERREFDLALCPACGWWTTTRDTQFTYLPSYDSPESFYSYMSRTDQHFAVLDTCSDTEGAVPLAELARILGEGRPDVNELPVRATRDLVRQLFASAMACAVHYYDDAAATPAGRLDLVVVRTDAAQSAFLLARRPVDPRERLRRVREFTGPAATSPYDEGIYVTTSRLAAPVDEERHAGAPGPSDRGLTIATVDGGRLRDLLMLRVPSEQSMSALTTIVPASGWRCPQLALGNQDISRVLEQTRLSRHPQ